MAWMNGFTPPPRDARDKKKLASSENVSAILGPTNTGKHFAIERMLSHRAGMIGLPLRLLAREVYNRVVAKAGPEAVALITGEEKIKPLRRALLGLERSRPCRAISACPSSRIDEIQIAASFDRGHVFTDRILNRRGTDETLLIGAGTMQPGRWNSCCRA